MESQQLQAIIEGALMAAGEPLSLKRLEVLFEEDQAPSRDELRQALEAISLACTDRGFELKEVASGWRLQVREDLAPWVNRLWDEKPQKYSRALLETLALIAYRQPITRGDIEEIRGVAVSSHIIKTLTEREWVKVVGQRDVPGRPSLYATTRQFLDYFNIKSLDELPTLSEIRDLDELNASLDLGEAAPAPDGAEQAEPESTDSAPEDVALESTQSEEEGLEPTRERDELAGGDSADEPEGKSYAEPDDDAAVPAEDGDTPYQPKAFSAEQTEPDA
ncbi:SMC-Scp complex subunit ScpB [Gilvimarinus xylanilyticus]|uniref:SMC-Scp complex subunit ScpB n=1 Tax=Gilvimarinus xylanilyticus TaxID=2944139 RepID=A0A9X2HUS0_9GAMM|nr:SMC-Scp complex subunit ScpB [Gilvimarinus xylanilyticus]MCP8898833.1 SMC-Scp complex subunit ScpB [Gilvimarinus xylanilyticus]